MRWGSWFVPVLFTPLFRKGLMQPPCRLLLTLMLKRFQLRRPFTLPFHRVKGLAPRTTFWSIVRNETPSKCVKPLELQGVLGILEVTALRRHFKLAVICVWTQIARTCEKMIAISFWSLLFLEQRTSHCIGF